MIEVKRYEMCGFGGGLVVRPDGAWYHMDDFDRVTAERDALQERLNAADQEKDDLSFQLNDREASRYSWFQAAQAAEKRVDELEAQLAERDALLREFCDRVERGEVRSKTTYAKFKAALSASAEPIIKMVRAHKHTCANVQPGSTSADVCDCGAMADGKPVPVERNEQAEFEDYMQRKFPGAVLIRTTGSETYRNPSHHCAWLSWQARAALDKATKGASYE